MTEPFWPVLTEYVRRRTFSHIAPQFSNEPPEWTKDALCVQFDAEDWYPEKGGSTATAKRICAQCPARLACLQFALDNDERFGVWGGLSERERRKVKRTPSASTEVQLGWIPQPCPVCGDHYRNLRGHMFAHRGGVVA